MELCITSLRYPQAQISTSAETEVAESTQKGWIPATRCDLDCWIKMPRNAAMEVTMFRAGSATPGRLTAAICSWRSYVPSHHDAARIPP